MAYKSISFNPRMIGVVMCLSSVAFQSFAADTPEVARVAQDQFLARVDCMKARPESCAQAKGMLRAMLFQSAGSVVENLQHHRVYVVLMPRSMRLLDMPQALPLLGDHKSIENGRETPLEELSGVANVWQPDGEIAVIVGEANLSGGDANGKHTPAGFVLAHEFGHAVYEFGLSRKESRQVAKLYKTAKNEKKNFPDAAAMSNVGEFFAQTTAIWFGVHYDETGTPPKDARWLLARHPRLCALLQSVYGPNRDLISISKSMVPAFLPFAAPEGFIASTLRPEECSSYSSCYKMAAPLAHQGDCRQALIAYSKALEYDPSQPWAWYYRGGLKKLMGDFEGARGNYVKALSLADNEAEFHKKFEDGEIARRWGNFRGDYGQDVKCR
jgi:tetratricopeptide (TPR) repeat protein